jgi:hypothetical protein
MAIANRRAVANRLNRERGNAPPHPSERDLAAQASQPQRAAPAKRKRRK